MILQISESLPPLDGDDDRTDQPRKERKPLSSFVVDHAGTIGMTWQEIDALRPPFVIDRFLRRGEVMLLGAESKSRKSWLAQDAGLAVAAGIPWLSDENGENGFQVARAHVHVIDLELNADEMRFRFAKARGNRFADSLQLQEEVTRAVTAYSFDGMSVVDILERLEEIKASVSPGDLVILDCLYRMAPDGNETAEVAAILETVKRFASDTQAALILVDHFRKAAADKARDRFAGTFIKQASASTLVGVEVKDDILHLNIDARTFHGLPLVHARFDSESYTFRSIPEETVDLAKDGRKAAEEEGWLYSIWLNRSSDFETTAKQAMGQWGIGSPQGAKKRLEKLKERGWVEMVQASVGCANHWKLSPLGRVQLEGATGIRK